MLVPCVVILGLDLAIEAAGAPVWHTIKQTLPDPDLTVRVNGKQFAWDFTHPGNDGQLDTDDDIKSDFDLYVRWTAWCNSNWFRRTCFTASGCRTCV